MLETNGLIRPEADRTAKASWDWKEIRCPYCQAKNRFALGRLTPRPFYARWICQTCGATFVVHVKGDGISTFRLDYDGVANLGRLLIQEQKPQLKERHDYTTRGLPGSAQ